jgi:hypothetical protein
MEVRRDLEAVNKLLSVRCLLSETLNKYRDDIGSWRTTDREEQK